VPDFSRQVDEEPPINEAVKDVLAIAGGDPQQEALVLTAMMMVCCEHLAEAVGRGRCRDRLRRLDSFIRDAKPVRPWRD
jgi:hypothetical protein